MADFFDVALAPASIFDAIFGAAEEQSAASGALSGMTPEERAMWEQVLSVPGSATMQTAEPPTLQQILVRTARQTGGGAAYTGLLPPKVLKQAFGGAVAGTSSMEEFLVFMGDAPDIEQGTKYGEPAMGGQAANYLNLDQPDLEGGDQIQTFVQAQNAPYLWDEKQVAEAMEKMRKAGLPVNDFDAMVSVWQGLVDRAARTYTLSEGAQKVTPWDVLDRYKSESGDLTGGSGSDGNPLANATRTMVSRSVNELTDGEVWGVLRSTLQQLLGRDPKDQELRDFTYRSAQQAARNPSVTRTTTKYDENGMPVSSNSRTSGGYTTQDALQQAYERAQNDPEYAEYQAATTYFNAALSALGPIGG